ncbi:MAG: hypothetical protein K2J58_03410 [Muribaculaceae bacterium]|nr:hypothetical protein [Muribaculaceae bacterium]
MVYTHFLKKQLKACGNSGDTKLSLPEIIIGHVLLKAFRKTFCIRFLLLTLSLLSAYVMAVGQKSMNTDLIALRYGTINYLFSKDNGAVAYLICQPDCFHSQPYASYNSNACESVVWSLDYNIEELSRQIGNPEYLDCCSRSDEYCQSMLDDYYDNDVVYKRYIDNDGFPFPTTAKFSEFCSAVEELREQLVALKEHTANYVYEVSSIALTQYDETTVAPSLEPDQNISNESKFNLTNYKWSQYENWTTVGVDVGERTSSATYISRITASLLDGITDESLDKCINSTRESISSLKNKIDTSIDRFIKTKDEGKLAYVDEWGSSPYFDFLTLSQKYLNDIYVLIDNFNDNVDFLKLRYSDPATLWSMYKDEVLVFKEYYSLYPLELPKYVDYLKSLRERLPSTVDLKGLLQANANQFQLPEYVESSDGQRFPVEAISEGLSYYLDYEEYTDIILPASINLLGRLKENSYDQPFGYKNIERIICTSSIPPMVRENGFSNVVYENTVLVVPDESLDLYKNENLVLNAWHLFKHIVPMSESGVDLVGGEDDGIFLQDGILYNPGNTEICVFDLNGVKIYSGNDTKLELPKKDVFVVRTSSRSFLMAN